MIKNICLLFLILPIHIQLFGQGDDIFMRCAKIHIENSLKAMGGDTIKNLKSIYIDGYGHRYKMDVSERSEGPYLIEYMKFEELRDVWQMRMKRTIKTIPVRTSKNLILNKTVAMEENGKYKALSAGLDEEMLLNPETILTTALKAQDLSCEKHVVMQGIVNNVITFTWRKYPIKLYLNSFTNLLTGYELTRPYHYDNYQIWGDIRTYVTFSEWSYVKGGIWYPYQWNIEHNGSPYRTYTVVDMKINVDVNDKDFFIPEETKKTNADSIILKNDPVEFYPGIWLMQVNNFNTVVVKQNDGILILDAPFSSGYSDFIVKQIAKSIAPNVWFTGVLSSSDNWAAIGGIRYYMAKNIPLFSLDLNKPIIDRLSKANFKSQPDPYTKNIYKFNLNSIHQDQQLGKGMNLVEVIPVRSESGERNLIVYFPTYKLLYASDLLRYDSDGKLLNRQKLMEMNKIIEKKGIEVTDVISLYIEKTDYKKMLNESLK